MASATDLRLSSLVEEAARRRNLTVDDLAEVAGIHRVSMYDRLRGRTRWSFAEVALLAPALDLELGVLLDSASDGDEVLA